jgi:hypothetical protein
MPGRLAGGEITDPALIAEQVIAAIAETVRKQVACSLPSWVCVVMGLIIRT